jgi:hypothetical protein
MRLLTAAVVALSIAIIPAYAQEPLTVLNPGFEQVDPESLEREAGSLPADWRPRGRTQPGHRLSAKARSGDRAALIEFTEGTGHAISGYYYSEPQPLPPCREVTVSAWTAVEVPEGASADGAFLRLMFEREGSYVRIVDGRRVGDTGGEWERMELSGTPPPEADSWRMSVEFKGIGTARFDDAEAFFKPMMTIDAASLDAPAGEPMDIGEKRWGLLGEAVEVAPEMRATTTIGGGGTVPPTIHLGVVWYDEDGSQIGVHSTSGQAWQEPMELAMPAPQLAGAARMRPVAWAASRAQWESVLVAEPEIRPAEGVPPLPEAEIAMSGHPRLFITPEHLQRLRELVAMDREQLIAEHPHFAHHWDVIKRDADRCFEEEEIVVYNGRYSTTLPPALPARHEDNFPYWTGLSREIERRIEKLATVYLLTGEQRYADLCAEWTLTLCEWPYWTDPDYGDFNACLDTGHLCHAVAFAYDFLYDALTPEERETIRTALLEKGAAAVMEDATAGWAQEINWPNGFAVVMGGMGIAGAATLGDDPRADEYVQYARQRIDEFLDTRDRDGGYVEGHTYGGYAMSHVMPFAGTLGTHGDRALVEHPYISKTLRFVTYCLDPITATSVNFCDSSYSSRAYRSTAAWLAREGDPLAYWYLAHNEGLTHTFRYVPPMGLLWMPLEGAGEAPEGWPQAAHYRDIGWTIARSGFSTAPTPGAPSLLFAMRSGYYGSHVQRDNNSFMLNVNGRWILRDPGYGRDATEGHSTLMVDGQGQAPSDAHVAAFGNVGEVSYMVGDASVSYGNLSEFRRHAVMVGGEYVVLFDEIVADQPDLPIASQLVTDVAEAQIDGRQVVLAPETEMAADRDQSLTVVSGAGGEITSEEYQGKAKVILHHEDGGLYPMVLWPGTEAPVAAFTTPDADMSLAAIGQGDATDYVLLNLTGDFRTVDAIGSDARLVWVRMDGGEVAKLSMIHGTRVEVDGELVVELDRRADVAR